MEKAGEGEVKAISLGLSEVDRILGGGVRLGEMVLIYGDSGTGKTSFAMTTTANCISMGFNAIYFSSEKPFAAERIIEILGKNRVEEAKRVIVFMLDNFEKQMEIIDRLEYFITPKVKLIVIDTITSQYRNVIADRNVGIKANKELNKQLALLKTASKKGIAVLITGQVRDIMGEEREEVVASNVLKYWTDNILRLEKYRDRRYIVVEKIGGKIVPEIRIPFRIVERGILYGGI
ncbi:MAG: AAA family ATPase [Candidatus Verstraetearchaeota archaeon]|nr:AAA family ATPase [Candidatus Verstraetearchaeota archaeon]